MTLRLRRGTDAERGSVVFAEGELVYTTDTKELYVGDGTTAGGILVTQSGETPNTAITAIVEDLTPQLGANLDLNGFGAFGLGNITIDGNIDANTISAASFVGDGSGLFNLPGGVIDGETYRINIAGDDSTVIVNAENNSINVFELSTDFINIKNDFLIIKPDNLDNLVSQTVSIQSNNSSGTFRLERTSSNDISLQNLSYGSINFSRNDINGSLTTSLITGFRDSIVIGQNVNGDFSNEQSFLSFWQNNLGVGKINPEKKLDVNGDSVIRGNLTVNNFIQTGSLSTVERDNLVATNGMIIYNITTNKFQGYADGVWVDLH